MRCSGWATLDYYVYRRNQMIDRAWQRWLL
ncbi:hypothetical protein LINGRAHAP2_LOCUS2708 [Linum grandiflorum]